MDRNGEKWELSKHKIGFFAGLVGAFVYCGVTTFGDYPFRVEFLIGFLAMSGFSLTQRADKEKK